MSINMRCCYRTEPDGLVASLRASAKAFRIAMGVNDCSKEVQVFGTSENLALVAKQWSAP